MKPRFEALVLRLEFGFAFIISELNAIMNEVLLRLELVARAGWRLRATLASPWSAMPLPSFGAIKARFYDNTLVTVRQA
jgi:hypothetical protein